MAHTDLTEKSNINHPHQTIWAYLDCCLDGRELSLYFFFLPDEQQGGLGFFALAMSDQPARGLRQGQLEEEGKEGGVRMATESALQEQGDTRAPRLSTMIPGMPHSNARREGGRE